jgi:hypothetical protein
MTRHDGWLRRTGLVIAVAAALVIALAYVVSRLFES